MEEVVRITFPANTKKEFMTVCTEIKSAVNAEGMNPKDVVSYIEGEPFISDVEAQKDEPAGYNIFNRAIFYVSRLVSSQKEKDFVNTNFLLFFMLFWIIINNNQR